MRTASLTLALGLAAAIGLVLIAGCEKQQTPPPRAPSGQAPSAAAATFANTHCPIMGSPIDPAAVPAHLTREFKGKKVAFCCGGCPAAWDKLTDDQKQAKLDKPGS